MTIGKTSHCAFLSEKEKLLNSMCKVPVMCNIQNCMRVCTYMQTSDTHKNFRTVIIICSYTFICFPMFVNLPSLYSKFLGRGNGIFH